MMRLRPLLLALALTAAIPAPALAGADDLPDFKSDAATIALPVLRATVTVTGDVVRIGDVIDNAGTFSQIAIYRAPDLGTTGTLPTAQVISALRAHQVIGVDTKDIREVTVTRLSRNVDVVSEMSNLITAQRAYEMNSKVISAADQMMQTTTALFR